MSVISTKRCSTCKETKDISYFCKDNDRRDGYDNQCRVCRASRKRETREKIKHVIRSRKKDESCCICGYRKFHGALHFHHIDEEQKGFNVSQMADHDSFGKINREVAKCLLLCANCHAELHGGLISEKKIQSSINRQGTFSLTGQLYFRF